MNRQTILIIGAGAAGLAAASDLSRAGREVVVIEARDRVGGRVFTLKDDDSPVPIELGAEFVHGKSPALWDIAQAANLQICEVSDRQWYFDNGKISKSRDFWKKIESLMDEMKASKTDQSLRDFLEAQPDDENTRRAKAMVIRYVEGFHAANIERIGIHGLIKAKEAADAIDGDKSFRFQNGYESLMQALRAEAESHGATFHLNTIVKEVDWRRDPVKVVCASAADAAGITNLSLPSRQVSHPASAVLVTLPLGVLQTSSENCGVRFVPDLPDSKKAAIQHLATGNVVKINLLFRERFWEDVKLWDEDGDTVSFKDAGFFHYPDAQFPTWWTQLPLRAPLLVGWVGGPQAERIISSRVKERAQPDNSEDSILLDQAITSLSLIFNISTAEIRNQLEALHVHEWHDDPFSRGAYSYVPVNGLKDQEILSQPLDNKLFFAGEATSIGHIGTVHGAIQSGQRAAQEILSAKN
jgi:monoamine oxidase